MNFDLSEDQATIKSTAREFLAARYPAEEVRRLALEDPRGWTDAQWTELSGLGWPGLAIAEDDGGMGLGTVEMAVVAEELGYALAPSPLASHWMAGVFAPSEAVAAGDSRGTVAWHGLDMVPDAEGADFVVDVEGGRVVNAFTTDPVASLDTTRRLSAVTPSESSELSAGTDRPRLVAEIILAAELTGIGQRALEMAVAYAKERKQFGKPIGSFQAVSHSCAQMLLEVEGARSLVLNAAWVLDNEPEEAPLAVAMAKAWCSDAGVRVVSSSIQVHGGIGMTWEHDLHLYLKRAQADAHVLGASREQRSRVADLLSL
jgi:alkylation response protein AidB-like acyl-CoA dehydrogenase